MLAAAGAVAGMTTSPAGAAVTVGQLAPNPNGASACTVSPYDDVTVSVPSGTSYTMPANGIITSWMTSARSGTGQQQKMKVYRRLSQDQFLIVGHDGPRNLTPNGTTGNTFPTSVRVKKGDLLGLNDGNASSVPNTCQFPLFGAQLFESQASVDLNDGAQGTFIGPYNDASNVSAVLVPDNDFTFGAVTRNKNGSATLVVTVPNAGSLSISSGQAKATVAKKKKKAKTSPSAPVSEGAITVKVKATGTQRAKLAQAGKVAVGLSFTYTPTSGNPKTQTLKVKLRKG
jgi:hypothetical protein